MQDLNTIPTFGSQYGFKPISEVMKEIPEADRPPSLRRWEFWKINRADTVVMVDIVVLQVPTLVTFGGDTLKLAATIGRPVEHYSMGGVTVPTLSVPKSEMANLVAYCHLYRLPIEIVI